MALSVVLPGTAGSYISTDDVNLSDADSSHFEQSLGNWPDSGGGHLGAQNQVEVVWAAFGDFVMSIAASGTGVLAFRNAGGGSFDDYKIPVTAAIDYATSLMIGSSVATREARTIINWFNAANGVTGTSSGDWTALSIDSLTFVSVSGTAPALTTACRTTVEYRVVDGGNPTAGDVCYVDAFIIREGTDPTFVPSLRIVGALGETIDPVDMPIVFAADGTPLTIGDSWAGAGLRYTRYDGAVGVGPVVADFNPDDIVL